MDISSIGVIGLGYVGLPLAIEFSSHFKVIGLDVNAKRIKELQEGVDQTGEVDSRRLKESENLTFSTNESAIADCSIYIVTVPTLVDANKKPDFRFIQATNVMLSKYLNRGDTVIYESTVYPGATEEICVPALEQGSGLKLNSDFFVGYSPERINPGDTEHKLTNIVKITSGSNEYAAELVDKLYSTIIDAGTHKCSCIRAAEAAKVIENTQRDVNIALINELAILFKKLNLDTYEILQAANTKWNFLPFTPGLVGGHCIGVDPYYLTHKAQSCNFHPEMILAGRRINDNMGKYVAKQVVKTLSQNDIAINRSRILVLGFTFKENCPDIRNTKVIDIIEELQEFNAQVDVYDPYISALENTKYAGLNLLPELRSNCDYDAVVVTVKHNEFLELGLSAIMNLSKNRILFDLKCLFGLREDTYRI